MPTRLNPNHGGRLRAGQPLYVRTPDPPVVEWDDGPDPEDVLDSIETPEEALRAMGLPTHIRMLKDQPRDRRTAGFGIPK